MLFKQRKQKDLSRKYLLKKTYSSTLKKKVLIIPIFKEYSFQIYVVSLVGFASKDIYAIVSLLWRRVSQSVQLFQVFSKYVP